MIDEKFLLAAVNIKRKYINVVSDIDKYQERAKLTLEKLNTALKEVERIQSDLKDKDKVKNLTSDGVLEKMLYIIDDIENEGKSLESYIDPLNKEIERLAIEEEELYKVICDKHNDLTEEEIVESVKQRLIKENLS
jgi:predicted lipid-binding transport protein (Tim44 family)